MPGRISDGYTLVEILVAVAVFSVLAASAWVALNSLSSAAMAHRERSESFGALQMAVARLDADLRQLASRSARSSEGRPVPALAGTATSLEGTRAGWSNPAGIKRSTLQRFAWQLGGTELQRLQWPVIDRVAGSQALRETVLPQGVTLRFRYRDSSGTWHERWPLVTGGQQDLPVAIEYRLDTPQHGQIQRLVVLE